MNLLPLGWSAMILVASACHFYGDEGVEGDGKDESDCAQIGDDWNVHDPTTKKCSGTFGPGSFMPKVSGARANSQHSFLIGYLCPAQSVDTAAAKENSIHLTKIIAAEDPEISLKIPETVPRHGMTLLANRQTKLSFPACLCLQLQKHSQWPSTRYGKISTYE